MGLISNFVVVDKDEPSKSYGFSDQVDVSGSAGENEQKRRGPL